MKMFISYHYCLVRFEELEVVEKASIDEAFMQLKPVQPGSGAPLDVPYIRHVAAAVRGAGEQHTVRLTSKLAVRLHHDVRLKKVMNLSSATSCATYCFQVGQDLRKARISACCRDQIQASVLMQRMQRQM